MSNGRPYTTTALRSGVTFWVPWTQNMDIVLWYVVCYSWTFFCVSWSMFCVQCLLDSVLWSVFCVSWTVFCVVCLLDSVLWHVFCVSWTTFCVSWIVFSDMCSVSLGQCSVFCVSWTAWESRDPLRVYYTSTTAKTTPITFHYAWHCRPHAWLSFTFENHKSTISIDRSLDWMKFVRICDKVCNRTGTK